MIEHRVRELFGVSNRIMVLNWGMKIAEGTPQEVTENEEVRKAYFGRMMGGRKKGTKAEGTKAEGTKAEGTKAEGTKAEGTEAEGTEAGAKEIR